MIWNGNLSFIFYFQIQVLKLWPKLNYWSFYEFVISSGSGHSLASLREPLLKFTGAPVAEFRWWIWIFYILVWKNPSRHTLAKVPSINQQNYASKLHPNEKLISSEVYLKALFFHRRYAEVWTYIFTENKSINHVACNKTINFYRPDCGECAEHTDHISWTIHWAGSAMISQRWAKRLRGLWMKTVVIRLPQFDFITDAYRCPTQSRWCIWRIWRGRMKNVSSEKNGLLMRKTKYWTRSEASAR